jgi:hypothetical protein
VPPAALFDEPPFTNNAEYSYKTNQNGGTTWSLPNGGVGVGVLVVDLTRENGQTKDISKFVVFQMTSDGAVTSIRFSKCASTQDQAPMYPNKSYMRSYWRLP